MPWGPLAVYMAFLVAIVVLANTGKASVVFSASTLFPYGDKLGHLFLMGLFSFFLNMALDCRRIKPGRVSILLGSLIVFVIVATEEFSQIWIASRTPDLIDLMFDAIGIYLFGHLAVLNMKQKQKP